MSLLKEYRELAVKYASIFPCTDDVGQEDIVDNLVMAFGIFTPTDTNTLTKQIVRACQWQGMEVPDNIQPVIGFLQRWLPIIQEHERDMK